MHKSDNLCQMYKSDNLCHQVDVCPPTYSQPLYNSTVHTI